MMDASNIAPALAADTLPRDHKAPRRHIIQAHDGRAEVWVHPGDVDLPPSVQLNVDDEAIGLPTGVDLSWPPSAARALAHALLAAADVADAL